MRSVPDAHTLPSPSLDDATLLVVSVQQVYDHPRWGARNNRDAERNIARLIAGWRAARRPIIHVHQRNPAAERAHDPASGAFPPKPEARPLPAERVLFKKGRSAFIGTDLKARLRASACTTLVVVGLTTDQGVAATTRMAGDLGFATYLVDDATATFERTGPRGEHHTAQQMHDTALASLRDDAVGVVSTSDVLRRIG